MVPDGRVADSGQIVEIEPPRRLLLTWRHDLNPEMRAEGFSRLTYEIEKLVESVKLAIVHEIDKPESKLIAAVAGGWPMILASLKSLLETGEPLEESRHWPKGKC